MEVWVVTKTPVDLPGAFEFVGAFSTKDLADAALIGAGTFKVAKVTLDRRYSGNLYDVYLKVVLDHRQF